MKDNNNNNTKPSSSTKSKSTDEDSTSTKEDIPARSAPQHDNTKKCSQNQMKTKSSKDESDSPKPGAVGIEGGSDLNAETKKDILRRYNTFYDGVASIIAWYPNEEPRSSVAYEDITNAKKKSEYTAKATKPGAFAMRRRNMLKKLKMKDIRLKYNSPHIGESCEVDKRGDVIASVDDNSNANLIIDCLEMNSNTSYSNDVSAEGSNGYNNHENYEMPVATTIYDDEDMLPQATSSQFDNLVIVDAEVSNFIL